MPKGICNLALRITSGHHCTLNLSAYILSEDLRPFI